MQPVFKQSRNISCHRSSVRKPCESGYQCSGLGKVMCWKSISQSDRNFSRSDRDRWKESIPFMEPRNRICFCDVWWNPGKKSNSYKRQSFPTQELTERILQSEHECLLLCWCVRNGSSGKLLQINPSKLPLGMKLKESYILFTIFLNYMKATTSLYFSC